MREISCKEITALVKRLCVEAATVLLKNSKKMGIPAMILAVLVSFSRLYIFVHYPTDVIASILLGTLFALVGVWVMNKWYDKLPEKLRTLALPARKTT